ncbi:hypothetical protein [Microbispora triticiradicis]|uniref:hypothetical protein n=1 Tax=Microbispora triticiradicis TaxID=2200763 RepID=UPI001AD7F19B|nr:hypothetical protein [Microbispora triticiradicis]
MNEHARVLHARLHLLDRQVVRESDDRLLCKVDDLEVRPGDRPYVTAILSGPLALGPRLGGLPGWLMTETDRLFRGEARPGPYRIDMSLVTDVGSAVRVAGHPQDLALERWLTRNVVGRIPGAAGTPEQDAPESTAQDVPENTAGDASEKTLRVREREEDRPDTMRLGGLLGRTVRGPSGEVAGDTADVRLVQDGPLLAEVRQAFRLAGLLIARRRAGRLFGYERGPGLWRPSLLGALVRRMHGEIRYAEWDQIESLDDDEVRLGVAWDRLRSTADL